MTCRDYQTRPGDLEDYLSGRLEAKAAEAVAGHLAGCAACREAVEAAEFSRRLVRAARAPVGGPSPTFAVRVRAAIRSEEACRLARGEFWRPLEVLAWRLSWSMAVVLALLVAYLFSGDLRRPTPPVSRQPEIREIFPEPTQPASRDEVLLTLAEKRNGK